MSTFKYFSHSIIDVNKMLDTIGVKSIDDLFSDIPDEVKASSIDIPDAKSEYELKQELEKLASKNKVLTVFAGAGSYDCFTPSVIDAITSRQEFLTSYTPYQPEISQGTLQYIFEYQSLVCSLTQMDIANASMYDGATATAEAVRVAVSHTRRNKVLLSSLINPRVIEVIKTYAHYQGIEIEMIEANDYLTSSDDLANKINSSVAAVVIQNPNYYGYIENNIDSELIHNNKSLFIINSDISCLSLIKTPKELGADIAVGDAQALGVPLSFGGPYIGYMATTDKLMRKLPGRIVGMTEDVDGKRGFVLTLQAREQHIRREKATSNICSNQSLMALHVVIYAALLGENGLIKTQERAYANSHYLQDKLLKTKRFTKVTDNEFIKEFVLKGEKLEELNQYLLSCGFMGGIQINDLYLLCATEVRTKAEIDKFVDCVEAFYDNL